MAYHFTFPPAVGMIQFLHILVSVDIYHCCFSLVIILGCHDICLWFECSSLMANDVEHLFILLLPSVYPLQWNVSSYLLPIFNFFLLLSFESTLYTADTSPLSNVVCKYFFPVFPFSLSFHSLNRVFLTWIIFKKYLLNSNFLSKHL